ncbi:MAG: carboxypeptidase regulatory-like domain-containing protein [Bryobacterales bacterium]|nr:carboxypeptidase regulatory-like domain-containing protein [Bryobacterales bacterium]
MTRILLKLSVCLAIAMSTIGSAQTPQGASLQGTSLRGVVTDPSGAVVPGAMVQIFGPGGQKRTLTSESGVYEFVSLTAGKYRVRTIAKGFTVIDRRDVEIRGAMTLDTQLIIEAQAQVINVEDEANNVTTDPTQNASALVLREKELEALSDDPDELMQQLQAMAGPSAGPNGGQIYIDGFTGGNMPPKASIREVRINSNPFSPEYDRPGFGRIEILTRPGSDKIRGSAFWLFNDQILNARNPLLTQSTRPPFRQNFGGFNLSGPIKKGKASFGFDFERRAIDENAFILATTLDSSLSPQQVNQTVLTPQSRTTISPRLDFALNTNNTMVIRYQNTRVSEDNNGIGNFSLASRAFNQRDSENTLQVTETSILGAKAVNETRFMFSRTNLNQFGDSSQPAISVQGAFEGGGAQIGNSSNLVKRVELTNITTYTHGTHTLKWGARLRHSSIDDTSLNNFGGTYTFFGGAGPMLDANNNPLAGTSMQLTALERYRRTLLGQQLGLNTAAIQALGGGASQFSLNAGTPLTSVSQLDAGIFFNDDWRLKPTLTLSYGLRYEAQTNIGDRTNFSPRVGLAWAIDGGNGRQAKTVLRAGFGTFFDRLNENATLQELRFNGLTQASFLIRNPDFYPLIPSLGSLENGRQPQQLRFVDDQFRAPRHYQASLGIERQVNRYFRLSTQLMEARGTNLQRQRNINAPVNGVYPYGDPQIRLLTESSGYNRTRQVIVSPNLNYKKLFLFGFYSLSYGKSNAEGLPADPNNLQAEWGPSIFGDIRHRVLVGTSIPMPWSLSVSPFFVASSGAPYNITTGRDTNGDGFAQERPALAGTGVCSGTGLVYAAGFGCFNLNPAASDSIIGRNIARGPANVTLNLRLARTWAFGSRSEGREENGLPPGMGGLRGGGPDGGRGPGGGGPGGGGPPMMGGMGRGPGGGGPPPGMFGGNSGKRYAITLSVAARNVMNTANYAAPSGDLSSPFFGQYRSLAGFGPFGGANTFNRRLDLQLRFTF